MSDSGRSRGSDASVPSSTGRHSKVEGDGGFDSRPGSRGLGIIKIEGDGGFDSRPSSRDHTMQRIKPGNARPMSGIIKVEGDGGFDSRPGSRGSGIIKVEGDGGFDSRPSSRDHTMQRIKPGNARPMSGIIKVEGDGGFDSRPPSSAGLLPGNSRPSSSAGLLPGSRPLSGIIKTASSYSDLSSVHGDSFVLAEKKKRLKSASRVTFPEAPGAVQTISEQDMSKGELSISHLGPSETADNKFSFPSLQKDNVLYDNGARRLGARLLGRHAFNISDYVRANDAKLGVVQLYNTTVIESRSTSRRSTPASSLMASRSGTPTSSRPPSGAGSRGSSQPGSRASSAGIRGRRQRNNKGPDEKYLKAKMLQQEKAAREEAMREEQQKLLYESKLKMKADASRCIQAWCRSKLLRACITNGFADEPDIFNFLNRQFSMLIALRIHCYFVRKRYEYDPYKNEMFLRYFSGCPRSTLLANWECNVATVKIEQRAFWEAHQSLQFALADLQKQGMMLDMTVYDLPTFHFSESDNPLGKSRTRENPFCAVPGCSRRPVKVCEWDRESKICDMHQYPSYWDRDTSSTAFHDKHPMNISYPNRREFMWMSVLMSLHPRLGKGREDERTKEFFPCHFSDLLLPKTVHGADKYGGNALHFIEKILSQAWTITVPDDCKTLQEALDMAKDESTIFFKTGYYAWKTPVEVRKRIHVTGEFGVILHGPWTMDEHVGGGSFSTVTCITACGQGIHLRGGKWHFLRCTLRGYGEGVTVISCSGTTDLLLEKSRVCGLNVDTGLWKPYTCVVAAGQSNVHVVGSIVQDAAGYGIHATNKAVLKIDKSEILHNFKSGLKLDQDADVLIVNSLVRDNTSCFEAKGQNVPVPVSKLDPDPEVMYQEECDCLQAYSNRLHGILWGTRQKPKLLLGKCQFKNSIYKGDIVKDNMVDVNDNRAPVKPISGTGHEAFALAWPDNSALRVTDGSFLMENYMFLRLKYAKERPDLEGKPYMLEREGWGESTTGRSEYASALPRPGTGGSSTGILSRPGTSKKRPQQNVMFLNDMLAVTNDSNPDNRQ